MARLAVESVPDVRDDEPSGIERGHGDVRNVQRRRLLGSNRPVRVKYLEPDEKGAGQPCTPADHEVSVDRPAAIGIRCSPGAVLV